MATRIKKEIGLIVLSLFVLVFVSGYVLFIFEKGVNGNVETYWDAVWLAAATASSVGYGDVYPVSPEGRVLAAVLGFSGLLLIGITSALFTRYLLFDKKK